MPVGHRFRSRAELFTAFLTVILPLTFAFAVPLPSFAQTRIPASLAKLPTPGSYPGAASLDPAVLDGRYLFRFSPSSPWRSFDRVLILDAFPGEQRQYSLELLSSLSGEINVIAYTIDRRPPEAPIFFPVSGDAGSALTIDLRGEGSLMLSVNGEPFAPYKPDVPEVIQAPPDGSSIITAMAYAVDSHGNSSLPTSAVWRLSHLPQESLPVLQVDPQSPAGLRVLEKVDGLTIRVVTEPGGNPTVTLDVPVGKIPVIAVQSTSPEPTRASFIRLSASAGRARAEIPVPWGYDLQHMVRYGYEDGSGVTIAGNTSTIQADFPSRAPPAPPQKAPEPVVSFASGASLLSWPPSMNQLYFSLDGSEFVHYQAPVLLPYRGQIPYVLSYQAANEGGRSAPAFLSITVRPKLEAPSLRGVESGMTYGRAPALQVDAAFGTVRFEMTTDGSEPAPPTEISPALAQSAPFSGLDGRLVRYRLRLASVDDEGRIGPERYLDFLVDREPPPIPVVSNPLPAYSASDLTLALESSDSEAFLYFSATDNGSGPFQEYRNPMVLAGSDDGRKRYIVRAYAEDVFGNRSPEMKPVAVLVDRSSLYVDPEGRSGASGAPDDPLPSLQDALKVLAASGRTIIHLRGNHVLAGPMEIHGNLRLLGGYDADWSVSQHDRASIRFSGPLSPGTASLRIRRGLLELSSVGLVSEGIGVSVLIDAKDASLVLSQVSLDMSGGLEATAIKLDSSRLVMDGVKITISSVVTGRALDAMNSDSSLEKVAITAHSSVRLFDALRIVGGQSRLQSLRIDASPGLAFSGLSLSKARVSMSGSAFFVKGGASSLRLLHLDAAVLTADTLFGDIVWLGDVELFRLGSSSTLRLAHATILAKAKRLGVVESRGSVWNIFNSIFNIDSPASVFAISDNLPPPGSISANCLWGFASFLSGTGKTGSLAELNRFASLGHPNFIEAPSRTFSSVNKGLPLLSTSSACIGSAAPLPWTLPADLKMNLRPLPSRDIGVEGLREGRL